MTQYEQMQQVINNYKQQFLSKGGPHSYKHFISLGISPENLNVNSTSFKDLPKEQVDKMKQALLSISTQTKKMGSSFVEKTKYEDKDWVHFGYCKDEKTKIPEKDLKFRIYIPIKEDADHHFVMSECLKLLINSDIQFTGKVAKTYRNDSLTFEFDSRETAKKFVNQFMLREELKQSLGIHNPFISDLQGLGVVDMSSYDSYSTSYTSFVAHQMEDYVLDLQWEKGGVASANIDGFKAHLIAESKKPNSNTSLFNQLISQIDNCHTIHLQQNTNTTKTSSDAIQTSQSSAGTKEFQPKTDIQKSSTSENKNKIHPLNKYKNLIMKYDIVLQKDDNHPQGFFVITDRATGQVVQNKPKEEMIQLSKDLTFAKSWIKACGNDLSLSGGKNEFGIDTRQWEYAFNDGAYETYNQIIGIIQSTTQVGQTIDFAEVVQNVKKASNYKYGASIVDGLLDKNNIRFDWQLNNIKNQLSDVANTISSTELENITTKTMSEESNFSNRELEISEYVKNIYEFELADKILEQRNISLLDPEYQKEYDKLSKMSKAELFGLLGQENYKIEAERQDRREQTINSILEKEEGNPYEDRRSKFDNLPDEELFDYLQRVEERLERNREAEIEKQSYEEKVKNRPSKEVREKLYDTYMQVQTLKCQMSNFFGNQYGLDQQHKDMLSNIPQETIESIKNTIINISQFSGLEIEGSQGESKSISLILSDLWVMDSEKAIQNAEQYLSNQSLDINTKKAINDFIVTKTIWGNEFNFVRIDEDRQQLYEEFKQNFLRSTGSCDTLEEVFEKFHQPGYCGNAQVFWNGYRESNRNQLHNDIIAKLDNDLAEKFIQGIHANVLGQGQQEMES